MNIALRNSLLMAAAVSIGICTTSCKDNTAQPPSAQTTSPGSRFVDNGDQTITDKETGLTWTKDASPTVPGSSQCSQNYGLGSSTFVKCLNANNYAGHSDWSVPTIQQLASLCNKTGDIVWLNQIITRGLPLGPCNNDSTVDMTSFLTQQGFTHVHSDKWYFSSISSERPGV